MKIKHITISFFLLIAFHTQSKAQTILWEENFNTNTTTKMDLNTTDKGGAGLDGNHLYYINNSYTGGDADADFPCAGDIYTLPTTSYDTPQQPGGITGGPTSGYLHIDSKGGYAAGLTNTHYIVSSGACFGPESYFCKMKTDVNTSLYASATLKFWWIMGGAQNKIYGEVYYSTDGGTNWTKLTSPVSNLWNQTEWIQTTYDLPLVASLRIGFRWYCGNVSADALDPGFGIDEIVIQGGSGSVNSVTSGTISGSPFCPGASVLVPYTANGTFTNGNVFTAQLSDANGSFNSPVTIGQITSTTSGTINAAIPGGTAAGSGYRIRVVSSNPVVTGGDNSVNLVVSSTAQAATIGGSSTLCLGTPAVLSTTGGSGNFQWQGGATSGGSFTDIPGATDDSYIGDLSQYVCYKVKTGSGSCAATSASFCIAVKPTPTSDFSFTKNGKVVTFTNLSTGGNIYTWHFGDGSATSSAISPTHTYPKDSAYEVCLDVENGSNCSFTFCKSLATGITTIQHQDVWNVYPDPTKDDVFIDAKQSNKKIESISVCDLAGKVLVLKNTGVTVENPIRLDLSGLAGGMYFLKIKTAEANYIQSVIKQ